MLQLLLAVSPAIVSGLTALLKRLPVFSNLSDEARVPAVRALAAFISLAYVVVGFWIAPESLDENVLSAAVEAFLGALYVWLASLGLFHGFFTKK